MTSTIIFATACRTRSLLLFKYFSLAVRSVLQSATLWMLVHNYSSTVGRVAVVFLQVFCIGSWNQNCTCITSLLGTYLLRTWYMDIQYNCCIILYFTSWTYQEVRRGPAYQGRQINDIHYHVSKYTCLISTSEAWCRSGMIVRSTQNNSNKRANCSGKYQGLQESVGEAIEK